MKKIPRLSVAAAITALACAALLYATQPHLAYAIYRCLAGAASPLNCWLGKPTEFRTTTFGMVYEGTTEDQIDRHVLAYGAFEKPTLFLLRDVSRGGVFLDIGANKGLYSLFMSKYQKEVHAFEPYEPVLKKFRALVASNSVRNIIIHPVGLGDKHDRLNFQKPEKDNMGTGSFAFDFGDISHEQLEIVTGDQALKDAGVAEVDLIKMDIEGFEQPALRGLAQTLIHSRPIVIFELTISTHQPILFKSMDQIVQAFPSGYKFFIFAKTNPHTGAYELAPMEGTLNFNSAFEQHDVIAFPAEKKDRVPLKRP